MPVRAQTHYREAHNAAFRRVLLSWLSAMPAGGWEGSVAELWAELSAAAGRERVPAVIPRGSGLGRRLSVDRRFLE